MMQHDSTPPSKAEATAMALLIVGGPVVATALAALVVVALFVGVM